MIYIRKIFKQDLRDGKQIAFPKEPSNEFFHFDFTNRNPDRHISFKFKVIDTSSQYYQYKDQEITTRLYAASSESRIDGELKQFLRDTLNAQINDVVIFRRLNDNSYEFEYIPQGTTEYMAAIRLLGNNNHSVAITQVTNKEAVVGAKKECLQQIFYGAPGTGKSHRVKEITEGQCKTVVTFHPDTDYSSFVGAYKPTLHKDGEKITYGFVPQAFAKAYVNAWKNTNKDYYLVIEEINRGNCAQIFGDIFQLLDRNLDGYSDYVIDVDKDFEDYLKDELAGIADYPAKIMELAKEADLEGDFSFAKIALPANLHIIATMNTSDQSLFPMDSAFKRRWDWVYRPIDYNKAKEVKIDIDGEQYNWGEFIETVNGRIKEISNSEDKQLGTFFVKAKNGIIPFEQFRSKVMFYLWFEVYKDEAGTADCIFKQTEDDSKGFSFGDLFEPNATDIIKNFLKFLKINPISPVVAASTETSTDTEETE